MRTKEEIAFAYNVYASDHGYYELDEMENYHVETVYELEAELEALKTELEELHAKKG